MPTDSKMTKHVSRVYESVEVWKCAYKLDQEAYYTTLYYKTLISNDANSISVVTGCPKKSLTKKTYAAVGEAILTALEAYPTDQLSQEHAQQRKAVLAFLKARQKRQQRRAKRKAQTEAAAPASPDVRLSPLSLENPTAERPSTPIPAPQPAPIVPPVICTARRVPSDVVTDPPAAPVPKALLRSGTHTQQVCVTPRPFGGWSTTEWVLVAAGTALCVVGASLLVVLCAPLVFPLAVACGFIGFLAVLALAVKVGYSVFEHRQDPQPVHVSGSKSCVQSDSAQNTLGRRVSFGLPKPVQPESPNGEAVTAKTCCRVPA